MYKLRQCEWEISAFIELIEKEYTDVEIRQQVFQYADKKDIQNFLVNSNKFYAFENYILQLSNKYYEKYGKRIEVSKNELYRKKLLNDNIKCLFHT